MKVKQVAKRERDRKLNEVDKQARKLLLGRPRTLISLADALACAPKVAKQSLKRLEAAGCNLRVLDSGEAEISRSIPEGAKLVVKSKDFFDGKCFKFGVVADTHLYSKYARLDVLECLYDIFAREKIRTVFLPGNMIDGECSYNKYDLVGPSGFDAQAEYFAKHFPKRDGIVTRFITGRDHEGWYISREGINVGQRLQQTAEEHGRKDLVCIGHVEADIHFKAKRGQAWMRMMHPGGGSAYAISYTEQKVVESFQGGEKPHILLLGHYHKFNQGYPREVHTIQAGCVQDQTHFMRVHKLQAMVGGCIVRFHQADTGEINRFDVEWMPFYDRGFYEKRDKYKQW